jgi:hypothetical protein
MDPQVDVIRMIPRYRSMRQSGRVDDSPSLTDFGPQFLPEGALALMRVVGQQPLFFGQIKQETVAPDAISRDLLTVNC